MKQSGFSLVEVLIATLLMGIVMATAVLVIRSTQQVTDQVAFEHAEDAPLKSWEQFSIGVRRDLDHVQETLDPDGISFVLEDNTVEWLSVSRPGDGHGILPQLIRYTYDEDEEQVTRATAMLQRSAVKTWTTNVVLESVAELQFRVNDGTDWQTEWRSDGKEGELPRLLQIKVERKGDEEQVIDALLPASLQQDGL